MTNYVSYEKPKQAAAILEKIDQRIEHMNTNVFLVNKVKAMVEKYDGKKITKKFVTALAADPDLADYNVQYSPRYGMFHVDITCPRLTTEFKFSSLLGYDSSPYFDLKKWTEYNQCFFLESGRIVRLIQGKNKVKDWVDRWNNAVNELQAINREASKHELEYTFEMFRE